MNEFCRCCNASLKVTYGDTVYMVSIVNLLKPTVGQDSFEVLLQNIGIVCERGPEWSERLSYTAKTSFPSMILLRAFDCPSFNFKQKFSFLYNSSNTFFIAVERYFSALCVDTLSLLLSKLHYLLWQYNHS